MPATLASLRIRNLATVEEVLWEPQPGFTAITGETGAGKSVLLGALMLLLGERADRSLIRTGEDACTVEAVFEGADDTELAAMLEAAGAEPCEAGRLLLKRTLAASGAGRQFVNGSACTLSLLRSLGDCLVDLHGPHDHQSLFSREQQTRLLDRHARSEDLCADFARARSALLRLDAERAATAENEAAMLRERDLLEHQVAEIAAAALSPDEEAGLLARHKAAANAARIGELLAGLDSLASAEEAPLAGHVAEAVRATRELARLDPSAAPIAEAAETAAAATADLSLALAHYQGSLASDPATLAALEARLDLIEGLKRKYGPDLPSAIAFGAKAAARLEALQARIGRAGSLDDETAAAARRVAGLGEALGKSRAKAARDLEKQVAAGLRDLGFARCGFEVRLEPLPAHGPLGCELAEFVFAPNPGEEPRPLRSIASSGEISRVMLALKGALAAQDQIPLLVFDEIDANVGGEIAVRVAARMRALAEGRQVLCITHLAQVAAAAHHHLVVTKEIHAGRTRTLLETCAGETRELEIARMLGGRSATARAHARELLAA